MATALEGVAKSIKALNHEEHEGHKGKEKLFFVLFVSFVVYFFSGPFATTSFAQMTVMVCGVGMGSNASLHQLTACPVEADQARGKTLIPGQECVCSE